MPIINRPPRAVPIGSVPSFWGWTTYTPVIPKLYWDIYSQEERIKRLCLQYDKLTHYASMIAEVLNDQTQNIDDILDAFQKKLDEQIAEQNQNIADQLAAQDAKVTAQLNAIMKYVQEQFEQIAEGQLMYDVTTGEYRPSIQATRRLFQALSFDHKGTTQLVSYYADKTVEQLAAKTVYNAAYSTRCRVVIDDQLPNE